MILLKTFDIFHDHIVVQAIPLLSFDHIVVGICKSRLAAVQCVCISIFIVYIKY